jgi:hypothetical protein
MENSVIYNSLYLVKYIYVILRKPKMLRTYDEMFQILFLLFLVALHTLLKESKGLILSRNGP